MDFYLIEIFIKINEYLFRNHNEPNIFAFNYMTLQHIKRFSKCKLKYYKSKFKIMM